MHTHTVLGQEVKGYFYYESQPKQFEMHNGQWRQPITNTNKLEVSTKNNEHGDSWC